MRTRVAPNCRVRHCARPLSPLCSVASTAVQSVVPNGISDKRTLPPGTFRRRTSATLDDRPFAVQAELGRELAPDRRRAVPLDDGTQAIPLAWRARMLQSPREHARGDTRWLSGGTVFAQHLHDPADIPIEIRQ